MATFSNTHRLKKYGTKEGLSDLELACISLYAITKDKTYAYINTIGQSKKDKNMSVSTSNFFNKGNVKEFCSKFEQMVNFNADKYITASGNIKPMDNLDDAEEFLRGDMTNQELKSYFIKRASSIADNKQRNEYELKIMDKFQLKEEDKEVELAKPQVYIPLKK